MKFYGLEILAQLISPFAPHHAEEIWSLMGHKILICDTEWPKFDKRFLSVEQISIGVQINGKLRGNISFNKNAKNEEIQELQQGLIAAEKILRPNGRLVVVSFHSIEDRIVKNFFLKCFHNKSLSRHLPDLPKKEPSLEILTKKPILPSTKEINLNKRSRSAKLRIAKRTCFASTFGEII